MNFQNLTTDGLEETQDRLGGFQVLSSGVFLGKIKAAYAGTSATSKAQSVTVLADFAGKEYRETFWLTNGKGENFWINTKANNTKVALPGFTHVNDLCLVTTNKPLSQQSTEEKVMLVYDKDAKKEIPTSVQMLVELIGKEVSFGILKQIEAKQKKDSGGNYVDALDDNGMLETREVNVTDKIFHHPSNLTVSEAQQGITAATFHPAWSEKNTGVTRDKTKGKGGAAGAAQGGKAGRPGLPPQASGNGAAKPTSLFGAR